MERPKRITVIAVLAIVFGVLATIGAITGLAGLGELSDYQRGQLPYDPGILQLLFTLTLIESVAMVVCGIAIRSGHRWARIGLSAVCVLGIVGSIVQIVLGQSIVIGVISLGVYAVFLAILWGRVTSEWFADVNS